MANHRIKVVTKEYDKFDMPQGARKLMIKKKISGKKKRGKIKYSKHEFILQPGYDFLENLHFVRHYIMKRYDIRLEILEMLLYFYPKQCFTRTDFMAYPRFYNVRKPQYLVDKNYFNIVSAGITVGEPTNIYTLSPRSKRIVHKMYKLLSGETKIPIDKTNNPMALASSSELDKQRMEVIYKLSAIPHRTSS